MYVCLGKVWGRLSNRSKCAQDTWLLWLLQLRVDRGQAKRAAVKSAGIQEERQGWGAWGCYRTTAGAWQATLDGIQTLRGQGWWWYSEKEMSLGMSGLSQGKERECDGEKYRPGVKPLFSSSKRENTLERFAGLDLLSWTKRIVRREGLQHKT